MKKAIIITLIVMLSLFILNKPFAKPQPATVKIERQIGLPPSVVHTLQDIFTSP